MLPQKMVNVSRRLVLSDLCITHDGYPLCVPDWATSEAAWHEVLPVLQALRRQSGDIDPVRTPDVSTWFSRTCERCAAGFLSRTGNGRFCSNACHPRVRPWSEVSVDAGAGDGPAGSDGLAGSDAPVREQISRPTVVRRRRPADASHVLCEHCGEPSVSERPPGRWYCSMRCARQSRVVTSAFSRGA